METTKVIKRRNGVNLDALSETVKAMQADATLGQSRFRVRNTWIDANFNRSRTTGFFAAGQEVAHKRPFEIDADEPYMLGGENEGTNPVEILLSALAACLTTSLIAHAAVRGIKIESLDSDIEGDIDLNGFLGLDANVPKGFTDIRVKMHVDAPGQDPEKLKALASFSPVYNTLLNSPQITVDVDAK